MIDFVVHVHEGSLYLIQLLKSLLQCLADVVGLHQRHVRWQDDVYLDEEVAAEVERTHRVDVRHLRVMVDGDPRQLLEKVWPRRVPSQHLDLFCYTNAINPTVIPYITVTQHQLTSVSVLLTVKLKCTLAMSHAAPD